MVGQITDLIHDWNGARIPRAQIDVHDESLRDGLQSPSVRRPTAEDRVRLLELMVDLGIDSADVGFPAAGEVEALSATALAVRAHDLPIRITCAARTLISDIAPIVDIAQHAQVEIEVMAFIGSSPIRHYTEGWNPGDLLRSVQESVHFAVDHGLPCCLVTEDTTRARPELIRSLYTAALDAGATRLCLADTAGHANPAGVARLIAFVREQVLGATAIPLDWHGHDDRGLALANTLTAIDAGVDQVHGTVLGIGERCGNTAIEQILLNLHLAADTQKLAVLTEYCAHAARMFDRAIPSQQPIVGRDAFRTASGVHAAAIAKAQAIGDLHLADLVYSSVPASALGRSQDLDVGPMSGHANVRHWLQRHGIPQNRNLVDRVLAAARAAERILTDPEIALIAEQSDA